MKLFERASVHERLEDHYRQAVFGHGRIVILYGEAGVGKTAVVDAFGRRVAGQATVLHFNTTTGNAGFCLASSVCVPCATDAECQPVRGPRAACLQCTGCADFGGTMRGSPDDLGCQAE